MTNKNIKRHISPWWNYTENLTRATIVDEDWAYYGLSRQALENKLTINSRYENGDIVTNDKPVEEAVADLLAATKALNGFPIYTGKNYSKTYIWDQGLLIVTTPTEDEKHTGEGVSLLWTTTDPELNNKLEEIAKTFINTCPPPEGKVYVLLPTGSGGLTDQQIGLGASKLIESNYKPEVVTKYHQIVEDLKRENPLGRLSILSGPPGTGKTFMIRGFMHDCPDLKFLILPSNMVDEMSGPSLLSALINAAESNTQKTSYKSSNPTGSWDKTCPPDPTKSISTTVQNPLVLVIEDADRCLSSRDLGNVSAISSILNLSDGILGAMINLRIICTTNSDLEDIDKALLRTGRLSAHIEVGGLDPEQAKALYSSLGGKEDLDWAGKKEYCLSDIYALAKGGVDALEQQEILGKRRKVGFAA